MWKLNTKTQVWIKVLGLGALLLQGLNVQAAPIPLVIPQISCKTDPSIFNTGINGSQTNYATKSPKYTANSSPTEQDDHWERAVSLKNLGGTNNMNNDIYTAAELTTPGVLSAFQRVDVARGASVWLNSPFGNAEWIALYPNGGTNTYHVFRYQFYMDRR